MISVSDQVVSYYSRKDSKEKHFTLTHKKQNHRSTKERENKNKKEKKICNAKISNQKRKKYIYYNKK